jgi:hypothetical protein
MGRLLHIERNPRAAEYAERGAEKNQTEALLGVCLIFLCASAVAS